MLDTDKPPIEELYHFGVKGMKWGVVHEDKPFGNQKKSKKEEDSEKKGLTDRQKKALVIGASVVVAGLAIYGGYKLHQSGKLDQLADMGKKKLESSFDDSTGFRKIDKWDVIPDNAKRTYGLNDINPGRWNPLDKGSNSNCGNCTIANELRNRGLDVTARKNPNGMRIESLGEFFSGLNERSTVTLKPDLGLKISSRDAERSVLSNMNRGKVIKDRITEEILKSYPDGARGNMFIPMKNSNHFTSWSINNGKVLYQDAQHPAVDFDLLFGQIDTSTYAGKLYEGVRLTRLDDLQINKDAVRKVVKSRVFDMKDKTSEIYDVGIIQGQNFIMKT